MCPRAAANARLTRTPCVPEFAVKMARSHSRSRWQALRRASLTCAGLFLFSGTALAQGAPVPYGIAIAIAGLILLPRVDLLTTF